MINLEKSKIPFILRWINENIPKWTIGNIVITLLVLAGVFYNISIDGPVTQSFMAIEKIPGSHSSGETSTLGTYIKYSGNINHAEYYEFIENPIIAKDIEVGSSYLISNTSVTIVDGIDWVFLIFMFIFLNLIWIVVANTIFE